MISQGFWGNLVCISSNPQVICEPSSVDRAVELWWLVACRFSFLGSIRSCLLFSVVAGISYGLWTHRAWRRENVSNSFGGKHSVSRGIDSGTTTVGVQTVLEGPVFSAFHETGPAAVCVRSGRNPKQENIEIGEFGAGRPDVGGRWPRREAPVPNNHKKALAEVALLFPTDAFVAELCWLGTLAWLQSAAPRRASDEMRARSSWVQTP